MAQLSKTLTTDLEQIWRGLSKPEGKDSCQISDFFDFSFCGLPHKLFASEGFTKAVDLLRDRFFNADQQDFLFKDIYKKRIPADGFHVFAESIWVGERGERKR